MFLHQEGVREQKGRGRGDQSKQRFRYCQHFLEVTLQFQFNYNTFCILIKFKETKENRIGERQGGKKGGEKDREERKREKKE